MHRYPCLTFALTACLACSKGAPQHTVRDGTLPNPLPSDAAGDATMAALEVAAPDLASASATDTPGGPPALVGLDASLAGDACVPASCIDPGCGNPYCGLIGDGCGGTLDCKTCPANWSCVQGYCEPPGQAACVPIKCSIFGSYRYCGHIGDGCLGTLDCSCPEGWACESGFCVGRPPGCTPATCDVLAGDFWCGRLDDGCGGHVDCNSCRVPGWLCRGNGTCAAPPSACTPRTSCTGADGERYCGTIGDGCGNALQCGDPCSPVGLMCEGSICGGTGRPPPVTPPPRSSPWPLAPPPPPPCAPVLPPAQPGHPG